MKPTALTSLALAALIALPLTIQPAAAQTYRECSRTSTGAIFGTLGGAALGGFVGSQIGGKGTSGLVATGAGVLIGGLIGNELGRHLSCEDRQMAGTTTQRTLETQPSGTQVNWSNPDSGNAGTVTPTQTYQTAGGTYCREFLQTIQVNGESRQAHGTACRQPDGTWKITG